MADEEVLGKVDPEADKQAESRPQPPSPPAPPAPAPPPSKPVSSSPAPSPDPTPVKEEPVPESNFDPIAAMDQRHADQKAAELAAAEEQNYRSALASHEAMIEFNNSDQGAVSRQIRYVESLHKLPSPEAHQREVERMEAEQEEGDEDRTRLGPPAYARDNDE